MVVVGRVHGMRGAEDGWDHCRRLVTSCEQMSASCGAEGHVIGSDLEGFVFVACIGSPISDSGVHIAEPYGNFYIARATSLCSSDMMDIDRPSLTLIMPAHRVKLV